MFVSREYDYALRILRVLVKHEQLTVGEICTKEHIPQPYSYKILKKLEKASLVKAYRGTHGGYRLVAQPQSITLYDIYVAVEGSMYISECMQDGYDCPNNGAGRRCTIHKELYRIQDHFIQIMKQRNLAEVLEGEL